MFVLRCLYSSVCFCACFNTFPLVTPSSTLTNPNSTKVPPSTVLAETSTSESHRARATFRSEYRAENLGRSRSTGPDPRRTEAQSSPTAPHKHRNIYIVRQDGRRSHQRPRSLHLEHKSPVVIRRRNASGHGENRPPSPVPSQGSSCSSMSRVSTRPPLVIVPPKGALSQERSTVQAGAIKKKSRPISAVQELNIRIPCPPKNKSTG